MEDRIIKKRNRKDPHKDIVGTRFGRLVVTEYFREGYHKMCTVLCDCGNTKEVRLHSLLYGYTKSCGCLSKEVASLKGRKHGLSRHPL